MIVQHSVVTVDPMGSIQDAIDDLGTAGGVVVLRPGTYLLTSTLTFPADRPVVLVGAGRAATVLDWIGMGATPNNDLIKVQYSNSGIESLTIKGPAVAGTGRGIVVGNTAHIVRDCAFRDVTVYNTAGESISFLGTSELGAGFFTFLNHVQNCSFRLNFQAGATSGGMCYVGAGCTTILFDKCTFDTFKGSAISDFTGDGGGGIELRSCNIEGPADNTSHWVLLSHSHFPKLVNCWFENTTSNTGKYKILLSNECFGASIVDCHLSCNESTPLFIACAQGSSGTLTEYGTSIVNCWININAAAPVGATILLFGTANETPNQHVLAGGGIRKSDTDTHYTWGSGPYYTETSGTLTTRDTA